MVLTRVCNQFRKKRIKPIAKKGFFEPNQTSFLGAERNLFKGTNNQKSKVFTIFFVLLLKNIVLRTCKQSLRAIRCIELILQTHKRTQGVSVERQGQREGNPTRLHGEIPLITPTNKNENTARTYS